MFPSEVREILNMTKVTIKMGRREAAVRALDAACICVLETPLDEPGRIELLDLLAQRYREVGEAGKEAFVLNEIRSSQKALLATTGKMVIATELFTPVSLLPAAVKLGS